MRTGGEVSTGIAAGQVQEHAFAKVNLFLHVTGRRADGYHLLDSVVAFPPVGDTVRAAPAPARLTLRVAGPFAGALDGESDNLVLRAARALAAEAGIPAHADLELDKHLPVASGIGGGSSDAAACLRALARVWSVPIPPDMALRLGADVPVCLIAAPARMTGIGEHLTALADFPTGGIVLVNAGVAVPTRDVFAARAGDFSAPAALPKRWGDVTALAGWLAGTRNDLAAAAIALAPVIAVTLEALRSRGGCLLARMSGSGATCFGLFERAGAARDAARAIARPGWWTWGGALQAGLSGSRNEAPPLTGAGVAESAGRDLHQRRDGWGVAKR